MVRSGNPGQRGRALHRQVLDRAFNGHGGLHPLHVRLRARFQEVEGAHDELRSPGHNYGHPTYLHPGQFCSLAGKAIFYELLCLFNLCLLPAYTNNTF